MKTIWVDAVYGFYLQYYYLKNKQVVTLIFYKRDLYDFKTTKADTFYS